MFAVTQHPTEIAEGNAEPRGCASRAAFHRSGAIMARGLLNLLRVEDDAARGFATGLVAHAIGTARIRRAECFEIVALRKNLEGKAFLRYKSGRPQERKRFPWLFCGVEDAPTGRDDARRP
jgi:LrgB-like family